MTSRVLNAGLTVLLVLILSTLARIASAQAPRITEDEYKGIRGASLQLLKQRPPAEYFYVGVGAQSNSAHRFFEIDGRRKISRADRVFFGRLKTNDSQNNILMPRLISKIICATLLSRSSRARRRPQNFTDRLRREWRIQIRDSSDRRVFVAASPFAKT